MVLAGLGEEGPALARNMIGIADRAPLDRRAMSGASRALRSISGKPVRSWPTEPDLRAIPESGGDLALFVPNSAAVR